MQLRWPEVEQTLRQHLAQSDQACCAYILDLPALAHHVAQVVASLPPRCQMFYAIKANSDLPVLQTLAALVAGFEVSSGGELAWVRQHFGGQALIFSGPGKLDSELRQALAAGVEALHVESLFELQRLQAIMDTDVSADASPNADAFKNEHVDTIPGVDADADAPGHPGQRSKIKIYLRVNLALPQLSSTSLMMGGKATPFGIPGQQVPQVLAWLRQHPDFDLQGFHFHTLSHQLDAQAHLLLVREYLQQVTRWCREYGLNAWRVNAGGGIGINYRQPQQQFDWPTFSQGLHALLHEFSDIALLRFECGRYLTAACGYYAMQVLDIKSSHGQHFVVCRGGTHHFRTPQAQGHSHPFRVIAIEHWPHALARPEVCDAEVNVVGQLCTPKDVLASNSRVERVRVGDVLVLPWAGAYGWHISHQDFLRHAPPDWLLIHQLQA